MEKNGKKKCGVLLLLGAIGASATLACSLGGDNDPEKPIPLPYDKSSPNSNAAPKLSLADSASYPEEIPAEPAKQPARRERVQTTPEPTPSAQKPEPSDLSPAEPMHSPDVLNILLLGTDERSAEFSQNARADSIMLLSLNTQAHTIKLVSIERGIGVPIPGRSDDWITHTFRYGGATLTLQTVRDCFQVEVERYVRVNFQAFEAGIDAIGGVDITLDSKEAAYINQELAPQGSQRVKVGRNHLDGKTALIYARARQIDSDWKRIERQRNVVQAAANQVLQADFSTWKQLADTLLPMIQTNLSRKEIMALLLEAPAFLSDGVHLEQMTIPAPGTCWNQVGEDGRSLIGVDFGANAQILQEFFYGDPTSNKRAETP